MTAGVANLSVCVMCAAVALGHHYFFGLADFKNLESLVPQHDASFTLAQVVVAVLPAPKDIVEVPLQVMAEGLRVMTGGSSSGVGLGERVSSSSEAEGSLQEEEEEEEEEEGEKGGGEGKEKRGGSEGGGGSDRGRERGRGV